MSTINDLAKGIAEIRERNARVESDKAWETSLMRKVLLILYTYVSIGVYLHAIRVKDPWMNAIVPAIGFLLSTLTLPYFKSLWIRHYYKKGTSSL